MIDSLTLLQLLIFIVAFHFELLIQLKTTNNACTTILDAYLVKY